MAYIQKKFGTDGTSYSYKVTIKLNSKYLTSKTFKTKRLAQTWAKKIEDDLALMNALACEGATMTLNELACEFKNNYQGKDEKTLFRRIDWWGDNLGESRLTEIHTKQVRALLKQYELGHCLKYAGMRSLTTARIIETQHPRSPETVNRMKMTLSTLYRYAENEGYLSYNPTRGIKFRPENNERLRYLGDENHIPDEEISLLKACCDSDWGKLYLLVLMGISSGGRLSKLLCLRWCDIDFEKCTGLLNVTKNGKRRKLLFTPKVLEELHKFRAGNCHEFPVDVPHENEHVYELPDPIEDCIPPVCATAAGSIQGCYN